MTDKEIYVKAKSLFDYKDGKLIRKVNAGRGIQGSAAGSVNGRGYCQTTIHQKIYFVHRLIWLLHYQKMPFMLDHINGDRLDNRIENLREVTSSENSQNRSISSRNTSGIKGVSWFAQSCKWKATIMVNGVHNYLGLYVDIRDAEKAVCAYREKIHGEYANNG